jgi:dephospho-CoA kinase
VLDVPLLVQSGWDERCDRIVLVECDEQVRRARMAARGWTTEHQAERDAAWARGYRPPPPWKTTPVDASGDAAYIHEQIDGLWRSMS